ncbi:unnamed protein product [Vicia faba]|uniref:Polyprotein n=1 Tax=Vicia faba TaxID=3906 RepID=A0AAV0YHN2_VICFA|nr:unnamed protein product [Vicia faba]
MHNFEQALRSYRNNELVSNFKSKFTKPVMTTHMGLIESHAAKIHIVEIFKEVKDEIMKAGSLIVKEKLGRNKFKTYKLTKYYCDNYEKEVVYDGDTLQCDPNTVKSKGAPKKKRMTQKLFGDVLNETVELVMQGIVR